MRREWYVYLPVYSLVLSGYATETEAKQEAERVREHIPERIEVLPRSHELVKDYARTHPAWAHREGFESVQAQTAPSHTCPVCGTTVAGGPEEYLGHIRTAHPEEWRRLETDLGYTLRTQKVLGVRQLPTVTIKGRKYYFDARLREYRAVDDPHDRIPLELEYAKLLDEASEGSVAWNAVVESIIEEKRREAEQVEPTPETGIYRCRFCGAPYAYRENLELHERGCPKRG